MASEPDPKDNQQYAEQLIDQVGRMDETGTLPLRVYNDRNIHELELERIFSHSWVFIGHETELPEPGDYAKRYIGNNPFIFVRDEEGKIQVLHDSCRHRGTTVVRAEQGNTSHFRCPYHNWTYKNTGELVGVPNKEEVYQDMDMCEWALRPAPQVDSYNGFVFATLSEEAPPFDEYIGDYKWYLDIHTQFAKGGLEVVGEPIRWEVNTNWKLGADNFAGDTYHTLATHQSVIELEIFPSDLTAAGAVRAQRHIMCDGHAMGMAFAKERETAGNYPDDVFSDEHLSETQLSIAKRNIASPGTVFPNLSLIHIGLTPDPDNRDRAGFVSFRKWQPIGPKETQIWNWIMVPKNASEEFKQAAYDTAVGTFSVSGNFEQDDFAVWDGIAEAAGGTFAKTGELESNYQMGIGDMSEAEDISDEWPGPGTCYNTNFEDGVMHTFHNSWYEAMRNNTE